MRHVISILYNAPSFFSSVSIVQAKVLRRFRTFYCCAVNHEGNVLYIMNIRPAYVERQRDTTLVHNQAPFFPYQ